MRFYSVYYTNNGDWVDQKKNLTSILNERILDKWHDNATLSYFILVFFLTNIII